LRLPESQRGHIAEQKTIAGNSARPAPFQTPSCLHVLRQNIFNRSKCATDNLLINDSSAKFILLFLLYLWLISMIHNEANDHRVLRSGIF
jgi:hypothetical protein